MTINKKSITLLYTYATCIITIIGMYLLDYTNNLFLNTILFLLIIILNRILSEKSRVKNKIVTYVYASEFCFLIFIALIFLCKENYFLQYKILMTPALILSMVQSFFIKRETSK